MTASEMRPGSAVGLRQSDEDAWLIPDEWWERATPWRGRGPGREIRIDAKSMTKYRKLLTTDDIAPTLDFTAEIGDVELAEAGRAALADPAGADPLGIAVLATFTEMVSDDGPSPADALVSRHGLVTAAEIAVLRAGLTLEYPRHPRRLHEGHFVPIVRRKDADATDWTWQAAALLIRLRAHLAAASDADYRAAIDRLAEYRRAPGAMPVRMAISYLLPTERQWCEADIEQIGSGGIYGTTLMMVASATDLTQLERIGGVHASSALNPGQELYNALVHIGPEIAPLMIERFTYQWAQLQDQRDVAALLARFPTDEAFGCLVEYSDKVSARGALAEAAQRFPRRAFRMLAAGTSDTARAVLRRLALIYPEDAAELGIEIEPMTSSVPCTGTATVSDLPEFLRSPSGLTALPTWLVPGALPPIAVRDSKLALPASAVFAACGMLASQGSSDHDAWVARLQAIIDPRSLAEFGWALFETWQLVGYPSVDSWVLRAQGLVGNDDTARKLTPLIRIWPGESAHQRAVAGLDALAAIGTDTALMQLNGIAEKVKFNGIKNKAREKIQRLAEGLGLSGEELADRLVPDFGLADDGTLRLDYGVRAFLIRFDEQLRPTVSDADGTPLKNLPKPGAKDDPELAPAAYKTFATLKKDVKSIAASQIQRFERAMIQSRQWTVATHRQVFVDHPLLRSLCNRLVWAIFDEQRQVIGSFRIAEDGSYADVDDKAVQLADDALVGIAHPLHLGDTSAAWGEVFADYEILQPFPQLERDVHLLADGDAVAGLFERFEGCTVPAAVVMGMTSRGWQRQTPQDNGESWCVFRQLTPEYSAVVNLSPGLSIGRPPAGQSEQRLERPRVVVRGNEHEYYPSQTVYRFDILDPVTASELLRDLEFLAAAAK